MKDNLIHICFVLDESGSMYDSVTDVLGGFNQLVEEQKNTKEGECVISLYRFSDAVIKSFVGTPVQEITNINYSPGGLTAMNDGIGTAIDEIGKWLNNMPEEKRPSKNMIIIMTDGMENASKKYTFAQVREKIKHQTDKYNWEFVYMGSDISDFNDANNLGIDIKAMSDKSNLSKNYSYINTYATNLRSAVTMDAVNMATNTFKASLNEDTIAYAAENNIQL